jgi:hypothetical protein
MKLATVDNFIKIFSHNLHHYSHIALCFGSGYATKRVHYATKIFMKLATVDNFIKILVIICANIAILPYVLAQVTPLRG